MSDIIVHLKKGQAGQERRKLLRNDVYVLFHEFLKQKHKDKQTGLSQVEVFLAAERLACLLLELPNVVEGIDDELDDLEDEAEGVNDAMPSWTGKPPRKEYLPVGTITRCSSPCCKPQHIRRRSDGWRGQGPICLHVS